jgi:glutamyl/glutaminyl-tRNA synthetase
MTADEATYTGERHRQPAENTQDSHHAAGGSAIRVLAPVPDLDWRADLFACAIVDDYEHDDELARNDWSHDPMYELQVSDDDHETAIWLRQPAHPGTLAGVTP